MEIDEKNNKIRKAYKYRIYPSNRQVILIEEHFELLRQIYNWALNARIEYYKSDKKTLSQYDQQKLLTIYKNENPKYSIPYSSCRTDVLIRLDRAYKAFFRKVKKGEEAPGFPKFKQFGKYSSMTRQCAKSTPSDVFLPSQLETRNGMAFFWFSNAIGKIKGKYHREIPKNAELKNATITKQNNKYFISFSVIQDKEITAKKERTDREFIEINFNFADDVFIINESTKQSVTHKPQYIKDVEKEIGRIQRRFSRIKEKQKKELKKFFSAKIGTKINEIEFRNIMGNIHRQDELFDEFKEKIDENLKKYFVECEQEYFKELDIEKRKLNHVFFRLTARRTNFVYLLVKYYSKFNHVIVNQPKFTEKILPAKQKGKDVKKEKKSKAMREFNKLMLDSVGGKLIELLKQRAKEGRFELTINKV